MGIKDFFKRKPTFETEEQDRGIVSFTDTEIIIQNTAFSREEEVIEVDRIEYVYLETCRYSTAGIMIYQGRQYYIPTEYVNTEKLCLFLAERFQFDMDLIYQHIKDRVDAVYKLYRKTYIQNFELLEQESNDAVKGFEVLSPIPVEYPWTVTKKELLTSPYITYENGYIAFIYPVRIGSIVVNQLGAYVDNSRDEVAISDYNANCYVEDGSDKSFYLLKDRLLQDVGDVAVASFDINTNLYFYAKIDHISFNIFYANDDNDMRSIAYSFSSFSITTAFDYPELLIDEVYQTIGEVSSVFTFVYTLEMRSNYKNNPLIKQTPLCVLEATDKAAFVWKDKKNQLIGFGDRKYAQWFKVDDIESMTIWNTLPAKGGGFSSLSVQLFNGQSYTLLEGDHDTMSTQREELEVYLGVEVLFYEDYNC